MYPGDEAERLRFRVTWLDRWRHLVAIVFSAIAGVGILQAVQVDFHVDWSPLSVVILFAFVGAIVWWVIECTIAGMMAIWETRLWRLYRDRSMPVARLLKPRRR